MRNTNIDRRARRDVATLANLILLVDAEKSRVMALLNDHERNRRLVVDLQLQTGAADGDQLLLKDLRKMSKNYYTNR